LTTAAALALILGILSAVPEVISDTEKLIGALKSGDQPFTPISPEIHAALDELHAKIMAAALAAKMKDLGA
jgi:hypothetical protein